MPLWVIREDGIPLNYTDNLSNPHSTDYKRLVEAFEEGIRQSYAQTPLKNGFLVAEVNDIINPEKINKVPSFKFEFNI